MSVMSSLCKFVIESTSFFTPNTKKQMAQDCKSSDSSCDGKCLDSDEFTILEQPCLKCRLLVINRVA